MGSKIRHIEQLVVTHITQAVVTILRTASLRRQQVADRVLADAVGGPLVVQLITVADVFAVIDSMIADGVVSVADGVLTLVSDDEGRSGGAVESVSGTFVATADETFNVLLFNQLHTLFVRIAKEKKQPVYKVCTKDAMVALATTQPQSHKDLLSIDGLHTTTIRTCGKQILAIIRSCVVQEGALLVSDEPTLSTTGDDVIPTYLERLDGQQQSAVLDIHTPTVCIAGAGSGKTSVLVHKVLHAITAHGVNPKHILVITFTRKAALELQERLASLGFQGTVTACTFNSFCDRILRKFGQVGQLLTDNLQLSLFEKAFESAVDDPEYFVELMKENGYTDVFDYDQSMVQAVFVMRDVYDFLKNECLDVEHLRSLQQSCSVIEKKLLDYFIDTITAYEHIKEKHQYYDYADQIAMTVSLLLSHESLLSAVHNKYTHIMVDEYQDINVIQQRLMDVLCSKHPSLFVVGDPRQSIYGFRGSKPEYIMHTQTYFPSSHVHYLTHNYRCAPKITALANAIIAPLQFPAMESCVQDVEGEIVLFSAKDPEEEALYIAQYCKLLRVRHNVPYNEIFVLTRLNKQLDVIAKVLQQHDVDVCVRNDGQSAMRHQVMLSTIHGVKGLQARAVFLPGVVTGQFPLRHTPVKIIDMIKRHAAYDVDAEELRLLYVAVTRAREFLYVSSYAFDGVRRRTPSAYVQLVGSVVGDDK